MKPVPKRGLENIPWEGGAEPEQYGLVFRVFMVTVEMATAMLGKNMDQNRPLKKRMIEQIKRDIEEGGWTLTHQSICLAFVNGEWTLIDGQNRLQAIIRAGEDNPDVTVPLTVCFSFNVLSEVHRNIDTGTRRGIADALRIMGEPEADVKLLASMLPWIWREDQGDIWLTMLPSTAEAIATRLRHPKLDTAMKIGRRLQHLLPPSIAASLYYVLSGIDPDNDGPDDTEWFFDRLEDGADPRDQNQIRTHVPQVEHPIYLLREWLLSVKAGRHMAGPREMAMYTVKAFNLYRWGETRKRLNFKMSGPHAEAYPDLHETSANEE
jgi:hypothetical protein